MHRSLESIQILKQIERGGAGDVKVIFTIWPEPKHGCLLLTKLNILKSEVASFFFFKLKTSFIVH